MKDQQIITKAWDHQEKVEEVLAIVLIDVKVKSQDFKEEWKEHQEARATKEALESF